MEAPRRPGAPDELYICYRHCEPDQSVARELHQLLSGLGFKAFLDKHDKCLKAAVCNKSALGIASCIEEGLDRAQALIGIVSPNSFTSPWISYEMGSARGRQRFLRGEHSQPPPSLRYGGETVCIAHLVCGDLLQLPAFLKLSTLVPDREQLGIWLPGLCKACGVDPPRSVPDTLASCDLKELETYLPTKRPEALCFEFSI